MGRNNRSARKGRKTLLKTALGGMKDQRRRKAKKARQNRHKH